MKRILNLTSGEIFYCDWPEQPDVLAGVVEILVFCHVVNAWVHIVAKATGRDLGEGNMELCFADIEKLRTFEALLIIKDNVCN